MFLRQGAWLLLLSCCSSVEFSDELMAKYREKVREMFYHAYNGYLNHAFPLDELKPITCKGQDTWGSFSLSLVDALDTLIVMGNTTEFRRAVDLVLKSVRTDANVNVSVFETNIRIVGGLVSAHMLSGRVEGMVLEDGWPCSGPLLRLAEAMAARLLPAFNTETGMPYGTVNLKYGVPKRETPITCTAGVGTFIVEFGALSRLTGDPRFERVALRALESLWRTRSSLGLVGNHINVRTGQWTATDTGIGAGVDSYFEYLVKGALLFQRPALMEQFQEYLSAINRYVREGDWFLWVNMHKATVSLPIFQALEAFWPGLLTMVGDVEDASRIILQYSQVIRQYGFPPEFYNIQSSVSEKRTAFPLRPEFVESLMYLYRATQDPLYLELGAQVVDAIEHSAKTSCGYATINNVNDHSIEDRAVPLMEPLIITHLRSPLKSWLWSSLRQHLKCANAASCRISKEMESFFLAETTKYLYLLFDPDNFLHNDGLKARIVDTPNGECVIDAGGYIFNTEAHPIDPAIVHCCSAQRQAEREAVQKWEDQYDLLSILDHHDSISPSHLHKESLPEFLASLKKIREDPRYFEEAGSNCKPSDDEEIEYEIDESLLDEIPEMPAEFHKAEGEPDTAANQNSNENESPNRDSGVVNESAVEKTDAKEDEENSTGVASTTQNPKEETGGQIPAPVVEDPEAKETTTPAVPTPPTKGAALRMWKTKLTQNDIMQKVRALIHQARLHDEEKQEQGEVSNSAERLVSTMMKIHSDYAGRRKQILKVLAASGIVPIGGGDLIKEAKELDDEYFEELKRRTERAKIAATVPVVTAMCRNCCYPTDEIGESVGYRYLLNSVYKTHIYGKREIDCEIGPLCWPYEEPRIEDNYRNVAPEVSADAWLPGDVPLELFYYPSSLTSFEMVDVSEYKFDLLLTPPLGFSYKFIGVGQVSLPTNHSGYSRR
ncbi:hypothetical protein Y032_0007g3534 [Ancylostoma ceylanicum]|uniref:alpha-1,2-Mannosidase n=1 Tax=Ancylostoma ceylanicum TaxID=53326 RepID=A0A016VNU7_9BILA|nr:hypothetical protein Y032_0007g3534 [Ancylostoma ceylanicum]